MGALHDNIVRIPDITPDLSVVQAFGEVYDWGLLDLNIPEIHKRSMGSGVKIAVIDSGRSTHFDVQPNVANAKNFTKSPTVDDKNGHSTVVSGIIAAAKNNEGIVGVAPKSKLVFAKAIEDNGTGSPSALINGIKWSISQKVDIISISAGLFVDIKSLHKTIKKAYKKNIIIIAACGNTGSRYKDVAFPARYPEVIGVAAYDINHHAANFSSRGINVAFAMPGVDVYSTYLNNTYAKMSGTSFAAPIMTGICALILSEHKRLGDKVKTPCRTPRQMLEHLKKYSIKLGTKKATGFGTIDVKSMFKKGL